MLRKYRIGSKADRLRQERNAAPGNPFYEFREPLFPLPDHEMSHTRRCRLAWTAALAVALVVGFIIGRIV